MILRIAPVLGLIGLFLLPSSALAKDNLPERYRGPGIAVRGPAERAPRAPRAPEGTSGEEDAWLPVPGEDGDYAVLDENGKPAVGLWYT